jgi:GTP cyclohydrolase II
MSTLLAQTKLPTAFSQFEMIAFESEFKDFPHIALIAKGTDLSQTINVRVHSECMTGDVFGSLRCDCGDQLHQSMDYLGSNGGVLLYLRQEGRGIGLVNKMNAYNLQDKGLDTFEANRELGHQDDERDFTPAQEMLGSLGVSSIRLITNNPEKIRVLKEAGINVAERIALHIPTKKENLDYLTAKVNKGHLIDL